MMPGFFDFRSIDEARIGFEQDPIEGLPLQPMEFPIQDPAQEAFQFPFQYPSQDPSGGEGGQYAPVDIPENLLQQEPMPDPFRMLNDLFSNMPQADSFNPAVSLVSEVVESGHAMATQQGFDQGVFGELDLNQSLTANVSNAMQSERDNPQVAWDWSGGFPSFGADTSTFERATGESLQDTSQQPFVDFRNDAESMLGFSPDLNAEDIASQIGLGSQVESFGKAQLSGSDSPVTVNAESVAINGVDAVLDSSSSVSDIIPVVSDFLDLSAEAIE